MSFAFPKAAPKKLGYQTDQVDQFVIQARLQFENSTVELITAGQIRDREFDLVSDGYDITAVDQALDRLEDSFAAREINRQRQTKGDFAVADRRARVQELVLGRASRPNKNKFTKTGWIMRGYSKRQVDFICNNIVSHLERGDKIDINQVRRAIFKATRNGYSEGQVDAFIDRVVELLQLEKNA